MAKLIADQAQDMRAERRGETGLPADENRAGLGELEGEGTVPDQGEPGRVPELEPQDPRYDPIRREAANEFNRAQAPEYPANDVVCDNGQRLDSYRPGEEIVSPKRTQLAEVPRETAIDYVTELAEKYPPGARIVGCLILAATGSTDPVAYALALCAGPAIAALLTGWGALHHSAEPADRATELPTFTGLGRGVAYLLVASFVSLAMANLAPVIVTGLAGIDPSTATGFAAAVVLTRVPLLLMGPIQALILPRLTLAAGSGRPADFRRDIGLGLALIGELAVVATAAVAVAARAGPPALKGYGEAGKSHCRSHDFPVTMSADRCAVGDDLKPVT